MDLSFLWPILAGITVGRLLNVKRKIYTDIGSCRRLLAEARVAIKEDHITAPLVYSLIVEMDFMLEELAKIKGVKKMKKKFKVTTRRAVVITEAATVEADSEESAIKMAKNDQIAFESWEVEDESNQGLCHQCDGFQDYYAEELKD